MADESAGKEGPGTLKFRHRIALLVALTVVALGVVTGVALVLGNRSERQILGIETQYLPLLELDRDLRTMFAAIPKTLESAASAAEETGLHDADRARDAFVEALTGGRLIIQRNGGDPDALLTELTDYYALARGVSLALIGPDPTEGLDKRVEAMRSAQLAFAAHLAAATLPDRNRIRAAFDGASEAHHAALMVDIAVALMAVLVMLMLSWWIVRGTIRSLQAVSDGVERFATGDFSQEIQTPSRDEFGELARQANRTATQLRDYRDRSVREDWIKTGTGGLATEMAGDLELSVLGRKALGHLARCVDAKVAAVYAADSQGGLQLLETYAFAAGQAAPRSFAPGEGVIGQAARDDQIVVLSDLPADALRVRSSLGDSVPRQLVIVPFSHDGRNLGVVELGMLEPISEQSLELLRRVRSALGVAFHGAEARRRVQALLDETQRQAEELKVRQEELRQTNQELGQRTLALEGQRRAVVKKNEELVTAQELLEEKATELQRVSQFKSEFLANMSHELRTPLNSVMILSRVLANENLSEKQREFANIIHASGAELLALIDDVLDLAKVEAGKQEVLLERVELDSIAAYVRRMFEPMATQKGLRFAVALAPELPKAIHTDRSKLEQILKNLLSNAIKFTAAGEVGVTVSSAQAADGRALLAIAVSDTGVGIPADKHARIFEAFTQADGGTSRKYGGTGLGLTIARQLSQLLGGDLEVESVVGQGSTFVVRLPQDRAQPAVAAAPPTSNGGERPGAVERLVDDRLTLTPGDPCLLVIEDNRRFAGIVLAMIRECGFRGLVAHDGHEGLELAEHHRPSGVILDIGLPDMDGWSVLERLKANRVTREIPVHLITASDEAARAHELGAGFLKKPANAGQIKLAIRTLEASGGAVMRRVLVVEEQAEQREALRLLVAGLDAGVESAGSADEAAQHLRSGRFDCVVLGLELPDLAAGLQLFSHLRRQPWTAALPVVAHAAQGLEPEQLRAFDGDPLTILIGEGERFTERVLEETRLFLHRVRTELPAARERAAEVVMGVEAQLRGKKVLIVDDDMRNVYSLSSALGTKELVVVAAADGLEALEQLAAHPDTSAILMDMMMPRLDGYETIRRIRGQPVHQQLPIIALTAKTMPGDRTRCLEAGATDYIPKPVDVDRLLSLLRVWLSP